MPVPAPRRFGAPAAAVAACAVLIAPAAAQPAGPLEAVDLELVLAVDVSQSVDQYEATLQRRGYINALLDPRIGQAVASGLHGKIAVTYVEWSGYGLYNTIVDWRIIDGVAGAEAFARELYFTPLSRGAGTSISGAIALGMELLDGNAYVGDRRVIDISGDGPNSSGPYADIARDEAVAAGIVINGVAINDVPSLFTLPDLDVYYRECVIGGPASFVLSVDSFESFADAILQKLVLEVADAPPPIVPDRPRVELIQAPAPGAAAPSGLKYAPACDIGERMRAIDNPALTVPPRPR